MSELSVETREGKKPFDILGGVQILLNRWLIPRLVALGIYLLNGWLYDENCKPLTLHGHLPGVLWYETLDGQFRTEENRKKIPRNFLDGYMRSIVREVQNIEELGLHGVTVSSESLQTLAPALSELVYMKRFYYRGFSTTLISGNALLSELREEIRVDFLSNVEALGKVCTRLESVNSISGRYLPHISAAIERDSAGDVTGVKGKDGIGILL